MSVVTERKQAGQPCVLIAMNKARTLKLVLVVGLLCSTIAVGPASAARPLDEGPIGTSTQPLETSVKLQVIITGRGSVRGPGFNCTQTCSHTLIKGDGVVLSAQEATGYQFSGWQLACGRAPQSHSCRFAAGDVTVVRAVFVQVVSVNVLSATPGLGVKDGRTTRKIDVQFDVGAPSVVRYELRQNGVVLQSWYSSSPFTGRSTRTIWIDDRVPGGAYEIGLRVTTGTQVRSFRGTVVLSAPA
jgi:Divergent InlB B-repeat domain